MRKYRLFETPEEVESWVSNSYTTEQLDNLNIRNNMDSALAFYKGNGYRFINKCVRIGYTEKSDVVDIRSLQELLLSYRIDEDIETFRFVDIREAFILWRNTLRRKEFIYPSFLSTTLLYKKYSMEYIRKGRFVIRIMIPKGTSGAYLPEVNPNSPEFEVLLPHHLKLKRIKLNTFEVLS